MLLQCPVISGTFIAVDISVFMIDATNKTQIEKITRKIRKQRAFSIQTPEQYLFVHQTLIEYAIKMGKLQTDQDIRQFLFSDAE